MRSYLAPTFQQPGLYKLFDMQHLAGDYVALYVAKSSTCSFVQIKQEWEQPVGSWAKLADTLEHLCIQLLSSSHKAAAHANWGEKMGLNHMITICFCLQNRDQHESEKCGLVCGL